MPAGRSLAMATGSGGSGGAAVPAEIGYLTLAAMNKGSARIGAFLVRVAHAATSTYSYKRKSGPGTATQHKFSCLLLGAPEDASATGTASYCMGVSKGNEAQVKAFGEKYKNGEVLKLTKVTFDGTVSPQYIHTPHPMVVDMAKTTIHIMSQTELHMSSVTLGRHVVPPRTVAETSSVRSNKSTDLLAFVKEMSDTRICNSGEAVADAILIDGSGEVSDSDGIAVAVFGQKKITFVRENAGKALVFLNLAISVANGQKEVRHWPTELAFVAPDCAKAKRLNEKAGELRTAPVNLLTSVWEPQHQKRDVSGTQPLSCCAFLDFASEMPEAEHMPQVVQLNWCRVCEPMPGSAVVDKTRQRIWFLTKLSDITGSVQVGVPERMALALAGSADKEGFLREHEAGQLQFPLFHNVRLSRTTKTAGASQPGEASAPAPGSQESASMFVSHVLEDVCPAGLGGEDAPNAAYSDVVKILSQCPRHDEALLFASLSEMRSSPHYGFEVAMKDIVVHGGAVVALVGSKERSLVQACGDGYKVTTKSVVDILGDALGLGGTVTWDAVAYCGMNDLLEYKLDPARGTSMRSAVVTIIGLEKGDSSWSVVLEKVQTVEAADLDGAIKTFKKLRTLGRHIKGSSEALESNKRHAAPALSSPMPTRVCRSLQRSPTANSLGSADLS